MSRNTDIGAMRDTIRLERRVTTQDVNGEQSSSWELVAQRFAEKVSLPGREYWSAKERGAVVPTVFRLRFPRDFTVTPAWRVVHDGRAFNVLSATDASGLKKDLLLTCEELVGEPL